MSSIVSVAAGTLLAVILLVVMIFFLKVWRTRDSFVRLRRTNNSSERKHDQMGATPIVDHHCDDMNPDIIPAKYGKYCLLMVPNREIDTMGRLYACDKDGGWKFIISRDKPKEVK